MDAEAWREDHRTDEGVAAEARRATFRRRVAVGVVLGTLGAMALGALYAYYRVTGGESIFGPSQAEEEADAVARYVAGTVADHNPRYRDRPASDVLAYAGWPSDGDGLQTYELLAVTGTAWDGEAEFRVHVVFRPVGFDVRQPSQAIRCYRLTLVRHPAYGRDGRAALPPSIPCPDDATPITVTTPAPPPTLPADTEARIDAALKRLDSGERLDPRVVYEAVQARVGTGVTTTALADDGSLGVAVTMGPREECVAARVRPDGRYETWHPPRVVVQPGELGCSAEAFAAGLGQTAPH